MLTSQLTVGQHGWWGWGQEGHCCFESSPGPSGPTQLAGREEGQRETGRGAHIAWPHPATGQQGIHRVSGHKEGCTPCGATGTVWPSRPPTPLSHAQLIPSPLQRPCSTGGAPPASWLPGNTLAAPMNGAAPTPSQQPLRVLWGNP